VKQTKEIPLIVEGLTRESVIHFQILFTAFVNNISLTTVQLKTLILLGLKGEQTLLSFSNEMADRKIVASSGSARNTIAELYEYQLINKWGKGKKKISLINSIYTNKETPIILNIKCHYAPQEN